MVIAPGQTAVVELVLQQVTPPPPHDNDAPVIDGVTISTDHVALGGTANVSVTAHDPNSGDTLTYLWTATDGSFADPAGTATVYTASNTDGVVTLTISVTDQDGAKATQSFTLRVGMPAAQVTVTFNDWPVVEKAAIATSPLQPGQSSTVSAVANDLDGDALTYLWTSSDGTGSCGTFDDPAAASPIFTVSSSEAATTCTLTVAVSDGKGGSANGGIAFDLGNAGPVTYGSGPQLISSDQSATHVTPGEQVTFAIDAQDSAGGGVSFSWANSVGTIAAQPTADPAHQSEVVWTAPTCLASGQTVAIQVTATDGSGNAFTLAFPITGPGTCMTVSGSTSTATVGPAGADLVDPNFMVALQIPAGALATDTLISVAPSASPLPPDAIPGTQVIAFGPTGTVFASPVTVSVPVPAGTTQANLYWRRLDANGNPAVDASGNPIYDDLGGTVQNGYLTAQVSQFSEGYVGPVSTTGAISGSQAVSG